MQTNLSVADFPDERRNRILKRLEKTGRVTVRQISQDYAVSEDTVRRDLKELESLGLCTCVYGGALLKSPVPPDAGQRRGLDLSRKDALGLTLASLVQPGQVVFMDAGSTNLAAARHLPDREDITVITHDPAIAAALVAFQNIRLISIGGQINRHVGAPTDAAAMRAIQDFRPDLLVLGTCALDAEGAVSAFVYEDAEIKSMLVQNAKSVVTGLLNEKLGTRAPYGICALADVATLVLEADAPADFTAQLRPARAAILHAKNHI
ncbi:DeoR/GlpR family DNA-binding transcription regulator [Aestuariivirga litoralis]|uniref:DeoR/GlpR family DNA-binding transcription regulator n=1 Tax=Aestuariivirga litoralis TaxID=2650924 RepID=UPI0018C6CCC1|nr:DeoR/GlpR family DNA-binding transcription regulator [Aestuariivirga litoralis]